MAKAARSTKPAKPEAVLPGGDYYQEWVVQITATQEGDGDKKKTTYSYEKLKIFRACVKISDFEAETLNAGILTGGNSLAKMYFKVEGKAGEADSKIDDLD